MNTTQQRIQLALAACEGLSDQELAKRGTGAFKAMIERKRLYAHAARHLHAVAMMAAEAAAQACEKVEQTKQQGQVATATIAAMDADLPEDFSANVSTMLAQIFPTKKG